MCFAIRFVSPEIVKSWKLSVHGPQQRGNNAIGCDTCHGSNHQMIIDSPHNLCSTCHLNKTIEHKGWPFQMGVHY